MTSQRRTPLQATVLLTVVICVGWVLCFWPARLARPDDGVMWMSIAAISCLLPGWIVVFLERLAIFRGEMKLMLGQISVRFLGVLIVAVTVRLLRPEFGVVDFYGWLIGFYLLAMAVETVLLREKFTKGSMSAGADNDLSVKSSPSRKL